MDFFLLRKQINENVKIFIVCLFKLFFFFCFLLSSHLTFWKNKKKNEQQKGKENKKNSKSYLHLTKRLDKVILYKNSSLKKELYRINKNIQTDCKHSEKGKKKMNEKRMEIKNSWEKSVCENNFNLYVKWEVLCKYLLLNF